jgi:hypothetical protein
MNWLEMTYFSENMRKKKRQKDSKAQIIQGIETSFDKAKAPYKNE